MGYLVGVKETGEILGWDRRKVSTYHLRGVLPKPISNLSSGPIWFRKQIEYYKMSRDASLTTYYTDGEIVYECKNNFTMKKTNLSPEEIRECTGRYILYQENDINQLITVILEKNPIAQFLSFESISFLHDLGILDTDIFHNYVNNYNNSFENIGLYKEGRNED